MIENSLLVSGIPDDLTVLFSSEVIEDKFGNVEFEDLPDVDAAVYKFETQRPVIYIISDIAAEFEDIVFYYEYIDGNGFIRGEVIYRNGAKVTDEQYSFDICGDCGNPKGINYCPVCDKYFCDQCWIPEDHEHGTYFSL